MAVVQYFLNTNAPMLVLEDQRFGAENWTDLSDDRRAALLADVKAFLGQQGFAEEQILNVYEWGSKARHFSSRFHLLHSLCLCSCDAPETVFLIVSLEWWGDARHQSDYDFLVVVKDWEQPAVNNVHLHELLPLGFLPSHSLHRFSRVQASILRCMRCASALSLCLPVSTSPITGCLLPRPGQSPCHLDHRSALLSTSIGVASKTPLLLPARTSDPPAETSSRGHPQH